VINRVTDYLPDQHPRTSRQRRPELSLSQVNLRDWIEPAEEIIRKYPAACLASAFVMGVAIAWWIKRT
jgi:hypothetical protein